MGSHTPIGFRFEPTDEEIFRGFLLPWNGVVDRPRRRTLHCFLDGTGYWHSMKEGGAIKSTTYVFTTLVRIKNKISRTAGGGPKKIFSTESGDTIGVSRMLSFEHPDSGGASSEYGHWIMHEFVFSTGMSKMVPTAGACDMAVCKIARCVKNSGGSRRKPPQQPQPQFFPPSIAAAQPEFFPPADFEAGGSDYIQVPSTSGVWKKIVSKKSKKTVARNKNGVVSYAADFRRWCRFRRRRKEDDSWLLSVLDFNENVAKEDDSWLLSALEFDEHNEKKDDLRIISGLELDEENFAKEDDSRIVSVLERDESIELPCSGGDSEEAPLPEAVAAEDVPWDKSALDQVFDEYFDIQRQLCYMNGVSYDKTDYSISCIV